MHEKRVTEAKKTARQICRTARGFISTIVLCFLPSPSDIQRLPMLHRFKLGLLMAIAKPCDDYIDGEKAPSDAGDQRSKRKTCDGQFAHRRCGFVLQNRYPPKTRAVSDKKEKTCSARIAHRRCGPPGGIRTPGLQNRNLLRYPASPRAGIKLYAPLRANVILPRRGEKSNYPLQKSEKNL